MRSLVVWIAFAGPLLCLGSSPVLNYSLKFGGSGNHTLAGVAVDRDGSVYIAGTSASIDFPTTGPRPPATPGALEMFVTRLSPDGTGIMCSVVIGVGFNGALNAMSLGPDGTVYLLGSTALASFPVTSGSAPPRIPVFL
jgi:hypothetical protein